ncbi:alpha/beta hydrolase [Microbacterium awajiense]|uniref:Alpha/beta hydrolase n=1 Tax=Microbacterium awajiense TaxID=415214 RepID=A0ABP7AQ62_9MICO
MSTPAVTTPPAPPFDAELGAALELISATMPSSITPEMIPAMRETPLDLGLDEQMGAIGAVREDRTIPGYDGAEILISIFRHPDNTGVGPGIYHTHGGGMIVGDQLAGVGMFLPYLVSHGAVIVSVDYRLAPEFPDPVPVEDCYAGLVWTAENAAELGIDPERMIIAGGSAGGGLAAGTTLLARDRQGPKLHAAALICPMIDDRNDSISARQIDGCGVWDRTANETGWTALLGDRRGTEHVSIYAAPARAEDLSGLPPLFIDVGSAEVFRDEDVAFASRVWAAGGTAELHVWAGGFHGFDIMAPHARVSQVANDVRNRWLARMLDA